MITGTLGIKADTKKSEIGAYFSKIAKTMKEVKVKLGKILEENGKYEKVKGKVEEFIGKISKIEEGAKEAAGGASGDIIIGNATDAGQDASHADFNSVNVLVSGIKAIVGVVLKENEGKASFTKTDGEQQKTIGKLFEKKDNASEVEAAAASASIGAISGADVLRAIAESESVVNNDGKIDTAKNAAEIAAAKKEDNKNEIKDGAKKDAVIAAGIALRAMAKDGKFAAKNDKKSSNAVNGVASGAVNKVLSALTIAIRNTVDGGLKEINKILVEIKQREGSEAVVKTN